MRRAAKVDANQGEVVTALRAIGVAVHVTSDMGSGFPDLVCHKVGHGVRLIEVKDGDKPPSKRRLTKDQCEFARDFPVDVVETVGDALALFGVEVAP